jgi:SAM-dependent methyltransferase
MAQAIKKQGSIRRINPEDIPFSIRLKAWWEGYDTAALYALIADTKKIPAGSVTAAEKPKQLQKKSAAAAPKAFRWTEQRAAANQLVWGAGFIEPPLPLDIKSIARKLDLKSTHMLVSIGAGLGGLNKLLADAQKCQADGYDMRGDIVEFGNQWARRTEEKLPALMMLDAAREKPYLRRYDRLLITQTAGRIPSMPTFLASLAKSLRPGTKFVMYDWFRESGTKQAALEQDLLSMTDGSFVCPTDISEHVRLLSANGFSVSENSLMTSESVEALTKPWRMFVQSLTELLHDMDRRDLADELLAEAELWTARVSLAEKGKIESRLLCGVYTGKSDR